MKRGRLPLIASIMSIYRHPSGIRVIDGPWWEDNSDHREKCDKETSVDNFFRGRDLAKPPNQVEF